MVDETPDPKPTSSRFRTTLVRVMIVQIIALSVLMFLQIRYNL
jgi:hypothetical protein